MHQKTIYLDHAATTYVDPRVHEVMQPYFSDDFGNPSSMYRLGRRAKDRLLQARTAIATILQCKVGDIIFTGSGTESDNLAIFGVARAYAKNQESRSKNQGHIITSVIEHHAVLHSMHQLEKEGFEVTYLPVSEDGIVDPEDVRKALRPDTILVSIMYANNEIGTIQPIREIGQIIKEYRQEKLNQEAGIKKQEANGRTPYFHSDACQAAGALNIQPNYLNVDLLTLHGSKIYGPKGIGMLFVRQGVRLQPIIFGGGQEMGLRSGTENVGLIVGLAKALEIADEGREEEGARLRELRDYFISEVQKRIPKVVLNGHAIKRLPNNINVSILDVEGEAVLLYLDNEGISVSTGSACTSTTLDPSHVILALGVPYEYAHGSIRFTLGRKTTKEDLDYVLDVLPGVIQKLRDISPVRLEVGQKEISHPEAFAGQGSKFLRNFDGKCRQL
jgi:cysteine desulfurase